jgi:uncharacterized membrane protein
MDAAKLRLSLAVGGAMFGFAGILVLAIAGSLALANMLPIEIAVLIVGMVLFAIGAIAIFFGLKVLKSAEKELDQLEEATADALADLPFDTIKSMVEKRPLAITGLAAMIGYSMADDPGATGRTLQRTILGII